MKMQWINFQRFFGKVKRLYSLNNCQFSSDAFVYGHDVAMAKKNGVPIVALESTIITHGMPYPDNLKTAIKVENAVRSKGAVPATIAILNGQVHVGLNQEQLETLANTQVAKTIKCSHRDISSIVSQNLNGGTTVSATMLLAHLSGIPIMATGGIGGVHRGAESTFDISTDLIELGRTPVAVVCSGVKSILDIEKTLEHLETQGVPVIKIGKTNHFPAFYCTETFNKIETPHKVSSSKEAANILKYQIKLGLRTGLLFAVPIPKTYALDPKEMELAICKALESAKCKDITGKNVTPFLLEELNKITKGQSLQANAALVENNANVAAEIAVNLVERYQSVSNSAATKCFLSPERNPVVIGGAVMDTTLQVKESEMKDDGRTHAGRSRENCGGVGRNIANALVNLGLNTTRLISVVGDDRPGEAIIKNLGDGGQTVERLSNTSTARYTAIIDYKGECRFGIGEMDLFASISPNLIKKYQSYVENASFIVLDGNPPLDTIKYVLDLAIYSKIPVWYEPTDVKKATKIFEAKAQWQNVLHFISPNRNELKIIGKYFGVHVPENKLIMDLEEVKTIAEQVAEFVPVVVTTLGSQGVLVARKALGSNPFYDTKGNLVENTMITSRLYPPLSYISEDSNETFNVSGCGDCLTAGIIYGIHKNLYETNCLSLALKAAALSLTSLDAVPASLSLISNNIK
ncbi:pseudouridine-metabolizing bifunctional protein C1861.05 [Colletes gigas]|uniref:pseudouridine-metabolizing bifunctional protein C1861.05 n=1 Tax=Colletes gigas TaxID=935657 RepID=UPI001C9A35E0|nr:pseudouridine-metabolizing bifunctional protein C1861.05 [Colletes gigas]